jgi:DNA-binding SARP family transcriptional activator
MNAATESLVQGILKSAEVPTFIVAPSKSGRSALALACVRAHFGIEETCWLDGTSEAFAEALDQGLLEVFLDPAAPEYAACRLLVVDDLPGLDDGAAQRFSDRIDRLVARGKQVIVICSPENDVFAALQSDRHLIDVRALCATFKHDDGRTLAFLQAFFASDLPLELKAAAALMMLVRTGVADELRALGYRIAPDTPVLLSASCPLVVFDSSSGYFDARACLLKGLDHQLFASVCAAVREGEQGVMQSEKERGFERLSGLAMHLFGRDERHESMEVLELAGRILAFDELEAARPTGLTCLPGTGTAPARPLGGVPGGGLPAPDIPEPAFGRAPLLCAGASGQRDHTVEPLAVRLFGDMEIMLNGVRIEASLLRRSKVKLLFVHLVLGLGKGISRDTLIERLWPGKDRAHARDNFYVTWSRLCRVLADPQGSCPYLSNSNQICRIDERYVSLDVLEFDELSRVVLFGKGTLDEQLDAVFRLDQLYRGDILAGLQLDSYVRSSQQRYRGLLVDVMLKAAQAFSEMGNGDNALWFARKAYETDATREDVYRILMDMQDRAGQRTSALRTYFDCKRYLNEELGIIPSQRTTALYQELILDRR